MNHMKCNFTISEFEKVFNKFEGNKFTVRINKGGNIQLDVKDVSLFNKSGEYNWKKRAYVFYKPAYRGGKIIIRSLNGDSYYSSIFPLNMNYKSRHTTKVKSYWVPDTEIDIYDINYSCFSNTEDAINYFILYLKKYKNINIK